MLTTLLAYRIELLKVSITRLEVEILLYGCRYDTVRPIDLIKFGFHPTKSYNNCVKLLRLGYFRKVQDFRVFARSGRPRSQIYVITDSGRAFVDRFLSDIADTAERLENGLMA